MGEAFALLSRSQADDGILLSASSHDVAPQVAMGFNDEEATVVLPTDTGRPHTSHRLRHPGLTASHKEMTVKLLSCDLCSFSSIYADKLRNHIRTHSGTEGLLCLVCQQAFPDADSLKEHSSTHIGEKKKYKCNLCPYMAGSPNSLARHVLTHTGERNFACGVCAYVCPRMDTLKRHINRVHLDKPRRRK
ncbi:zinc finger protein 513-like [Rhipicephalus sanguineus]|uniref:zinc finger protein 513-like n=1 Tax=Rhipicephalus sanguineus TaxID=34632 RepID=UPI0020C1CDB1|nr:zinc finger protein 513-like [Rhipicephalus sanguineus]